MHYRCGKQLPKSSGIVNQLILQAHDQGLTQESSLSRLALNLGSNQRKFNRTKGSNGFFGHPVLSVELKLNKMISEKLVLAGLLLLISLHQRPSASAFIVPLSKLFILLLFLISSLSQAAILTL